MRPSMSQNGRSTNKPADCKRLPPLSSSRFLNRSTDVYFDRSLAGLSEEALPRAKAAQMKLEHYYKVVVDAAVERNQR